MKGTCIVWETRDDDRNALFFSLEIIWKTLYFHILVNGWNQLCDWSIFLTSLMLIFCKITQTSAMSGGWLCVFLIKQNNFEVYQVKQVIRVCQCFHCKCFGFHFQFSNVVTDKYNFCRLNGMNRTKTFLWLVRSTIVDGISVQSL